MAVSFVTGGTGGAHGTSATATFTITAGDTVVVVVGVNGGSSVSSVTDTGGSIYTNPIFVTGLSIWSTAAGGALASTSVTVNLATTDLFVFGAGDYHGVTGLGLTNTNSGTSTTPTIAASVGASSSWSVAGFSTTGLDSVTANIGNLRENNNLKVGAKSETEALADNTGGATSNTVTVTLGASQSWLAVALELLSAAAAPPVADLTMKNPLFNTLLRM